MKKYLVISTFLLLTVIGVAQNHRNNYNIVKDVNGNYRYENMQGFKASFSTDIFGNKIYKDDHNNEVTYAKEVWADVFPRFNGDEKRILEWLADVFSESRDVKEKYKRNIHGNLEYVNNSTGLESSMKKSIFDEGIYTDNRGNEIKYSKEFWHEILNDFRNNDVQVFFWMMDYCENQSNYKEEYKVDIFGNLQYKNNKGGEASLSNTNNENKLYKDNTGNKREYKPGVWNRILSRHKSEGKAFIMLVNNHLLAQ